MGADFSRTLILVNPNARRGNLGVQWPVWEKQILDVLKEDSAQVVFTTPHEHGSTLVKKSLSAGVKKVIVVGGDGTLSEAVRGLFQGEHKISSDVVMISLPGGRGDDFFKSLS